MASSRNSRLNRTIYRQLLRCSQNGQNPEVFGEYGPLFCKHSNGISSIFPSSSDEVRSVIHDAFLRGSSSIGESKKDVEIFDILRKTNQLSSILHPYTIIEPTNSNGYSCNSIDASNYIPTSTTTTSPTSSSTIINTASIPIFDFTSSSLLAGESISFNFFEPRYRLLANEALSSCNGNFILRPARRGNQEEVIGALVKIVQHAEAINGNVVVWCIAGPRVLIHRDEQGQDDIEGEPLMRAMETKLCYDLDSTVDKKRGTTISSTLTFRMNHQNEESISNEIQSNADISISLHEMRSQVLQLLLRITSYDNITAFGLPPINPESFSFWALRFVLSSNDMSSRLQWLMCRSTTRRLQFILDVLETIVQQNT